MASRAWCRCSRKICSPNSASSPAKHRDGIRFASNMCPSKGTMDIFVEPVLPHPSLVILGASPVAMSLAAQARQLGYHVTLAAPSADLVVDSRTPTRWSTALRSANLTTTRRFIVVSTQGKGDEAALRAAVFDRCGISRLRRQPPQDGRAARKAVAAGVAAEALDRVKAPAGLDLGAITPEEIAMSILAEITVERRRGQRNPDHAAP